jgi:protein PET100
MGGLKLEVFKFGLYLFVPIVALLHFGDPEWYHTHVLPVSGFYLQPRDFFTASAGSTKIVCLDRDRTM